MSPFIAMQRAMLMVALGAVVACHHDAAADAATEPAAPGRADWSAPTAPSTSPSTAVTPAAGDVPNFNVDVHGSVAGLDFAPPYGLAVRGRLQVGDHAELIVFVASDVPNMCEHLQQGTLPSNSTMFATGLMQSNGARTAQVGDEFVAAGDQSYPPKLMANGFFRQLDHACQIDARLLPRGGEALYGSATLAALDESSATVQFAYDMIVDDNEDDTVGRLEGSMTVPWCDAPLLFVNAEQLHTGEVKPNMCR